MKKTAALVLCAVLSAPLTLAQDALEGAVWGIYAKKTGGEVLSSHNSGVRMVPASTRKLVSTGTALHAFGPEYRFRTGIGITGTVLEDGTLRGDVYIVGGGDPSLASADTIALRPEVLFRKWKAILGESGIQRIDGRIIGDGSAYEGPLEATSWDYEDTGTYYGTGCNALSFYQNAVDMEVRATAEGETVGLRQIYPETPWMKISNFGVTGPAGSGNSLYLFTSDISPRAELRGTYGADRRPRTEHVSNKFGDLTCAYYFWRYLRDSGWEVSGGYARVDRGGNVSGPDFGSAEKAGKPRMLGYSEGPRLADIVRLTNVRSDNFYAESILRAMGETASGIAVYDSCLVAEADVLRDLGLDTPVFVDGSGLSRRNRVSPEWMVSFLEAMMGSPAFPAFLASLPRPGEGTLYGMNFPGCERVRMKSGSFEGTQCYAGYILDGNGRPAVVFSVMAGNATASRSQLVKALEARIRALIQ